MPSIKTTTKGGVIRWDRDDWLAGLMPNFFAGNSAMQISNGMERAEACSSHRFPGYLSPGYDFTPYTNDSVIDSTILGGAYYNTYTHLIGDSAKIYKLFLTTDSMLNSVAHTIVAHGGAATPVGDFMLKYWSNRGGTLLERLFYTWNDNTSGDLGFANSSGTSWDDDFGSTIPTGGATLNKNYPHPMIVGSDGLLYIGNGNVIDSYEGSNGTNGLYTPEHHDLPKGYIITSFSKTANQLVIYAYRPTAPNSLHSYTADCAAFFWDYQNALHTAVYDLPGNYANGGFQFNGTVGCFLEDKSTLLATNNGKMVIFDGLKFSVIKTITTPIPTHGGVETMENIIYFKAGSYLYSYGSPFSNMPNCLSILSKPGTGGGICKNFFSDNLTIAGLNGVNKSLGNLSNFSTDLDVALPTVMPPMPMESKCRIQNVRVSFMAETSGTGFNTTLSLKLNKKQESSIVFENLTTVTNDTMVMNFKHDTSGVDFKMFNTIGWTLTAGGSQSATPPIIESIEVYFEYVNI